MKIYINARFLTQHLSGVQRYGIECSRKIKKLHPEAVFLAPKNILNKEVAEELGVQVIGTRKGHLWEQVDLPLFLKKEGSPPLFNPCNTAPLTYTGNFITLHDLAFYHHPEWNSRPFSLWYNFIIPRIVKRARHLFTVSETISGEIQKYYGVSPNKVSVTYNGISEKMISGGVGGDAVKEKIILAVGSFNVRKNHQSLVRAFVESDIKNTHALVIVGDKNKVFRDTGIDEAELARNNIRVHSYLSEAELTGMYRKAEIVVSLSVYEGFGIPILEGLFYGCKAVCSDIPVYRELFEKSAIFCQPTEIGGIVDAIHKAISAKQADRADLELLLAKYNYEASAKVIVGSMLTK